MKLSKKGEYALRALIDLGIAKELGRPIIQVSELARKEQLPVKFLEQILHQLRINGIIATKRGKYGGYYIKMPLNEIVMGAIIRMIDGPLAPIPCVSKSAYAPCSCPDEDHCGLRLLMMDVRNAVSNILDRYTLAQVVEVTLRKMKQSGVEAPFQNKEGGSHSRSILDILKDE